ncbi:MAG: phosphatase PAP2 family protein [Fimbriimonadaceae bacterium]|nr:phosphatase PAP2 family protein [Fimbriimonadaceae bacterium]
MRRIRWTALAVVLVASVVGTQARADEVTHWNQQALNAIRTTSMNPPMASRALAITHAAIFDAVNAVDQTHNPYHFVGTVNPNCSREAAVAQAAYRTLAAAFPTQQVNLQNELNARLALIPGGQAKTDGIQLGNAVADDILQLRSADGSTFNPGPYTGSNVIGKWRPTPPGFANGLLPAWGAVTPFTMTSGSQFRQGPPPAINSPEYTAAYNEVKELGSASSATRTADQTNIARFWADGGGTTTPPGHWNRIAQTVAADRNTTLSENARMFALMNLTMADAGIACWDMKYVYEYWRPVTGIREGDADGNLDTVGDASWNPLITTPPFPSFTSGHSTFSGGAATVLASFFGTDNVSFTSTAEGFAVPDRNFTSFSQAANEAKDSRLFGGIHWRFDNEVGMTMGNDLGRYVYNNYLTPVPEPGTMAALGLGALVLIRRRRRK